MPPQSLKKTTVTDLTYRLDIAPSCEQIFTQKTKTHMLGTTQSAALVGVDAHPVQVEVNSGEAGELKFILVGLPDAAVKESQDRVFSALVNSVPYKYGRLRNPEEAIG